MDPDAPGEPIRPGLVCFAAMVFGPLALVLLDWRIAIALFVAFGLAFDNVVNDTWGTPEWLAIALAFVALISSPVLAYMIAWRRRERYLSVHPQARTPAAPPPKPPPAETPASERPIARITGLIVGAPLVVFGVFVFLPLLKQDPEAQFWLNYVPRVVGTFAVGFPSLAFGLILLIEGTFSGRHFLHSRALWKLRSIARK